MAGKKSGNTKSQKNTREARQVLVYRIVFVVLSLILLFSMLLSAVATF